MDFDLTKRYCWYFNELSKIPHGSCNEKKASEWIQNFAKNLNLEYHADEWGNVVIRKPASEGYENSEYLMLQAHMDMIMAKTEDSNHDFATDPLDLYVENGYLKARNTTLGADDGVGIAYMMAILEDDSLKHPPLECVFTVMEEIGLLGALKMKPADILSRRVISLDGGGETATMCCAAGGIKASATQEIEYEPVKYKNQYCYTLEGFLGGHSGIAIDQERANAIQLASKFLASLKVNQIPYQLLDIHGGTGDNAIPSECSIIFATDVQEEVLKNLQTKLEEEINLQYSDSEPSWKASLLKISSTDKKGISEKNTKNLIYLLELLPNGVFSKSIPLNGIPVTSNNIGFIQIKNDLIQVDYRIRSLLECGLDDILRKTNMLCDMTGFKEEVIIRYPGWNYQKESKMRDLFCQLVKQEYGIDAIVEGTHGGNETGIWSGLHPDSDIISIGSIEEDIHTPNEKLNLEAFDRMYQLLIKLIARCK